MKLLSDSSIIRLLIASGGFILLFLWVYRLDKKTQSYMINFKKCKKMIAVKKARYIYKKLQYKTNQSAKNFSFIRMNCKELST